MATEMTRRTFLQKSSLVVAAAALSSELNLWNASPARGQTGGTFKPHAFVEIAADDTVTVWLGQTNLGQGTHTGISMVVAEELDADWKNVQAKMALAAEPFKNPYWHAQVTGGSTSIRHRWDMLRSAGATARQMLVEAAARQWESSAAQCSTKKGHVLHPDGRSLGYGQLVAAAASLPVPENPPLKKPQDYRIIGSARDRLDIPDKVAGRTKYGIDMAVPGMCIAVVARRPRFGAVPKSYDAQAAKGVKGVIEVLPMDDRIAVCAETTYAAIQGRAKLNIEWSEGTDPQLDNARLEKLFAEHLQKPGAVAQSTGDASKALAVANITLEGSYAFPYLAHAALEPINCTAHVEKDRCHIWVPTQGQTAAQRTAASITGLPIEKIDLMTTPAGGGFGLRGETDPVADAVTISKALNRPVKVMWTREDDFANDYFRPGSASRIEAGLDEQGRITGWSQKVAAPSILSRIMPQHVKEGIDSTSVQGISDMVYTIADRQVEYVMMELPIPVGFWRSVGYSTTTYMVETFMDELAGAAGKDPVEFRLAHLEKDSRPYRTLELLAEKSSWGDRPVQGRTRGIALGSCFGSSAGHVAEISVDRQSGKVTVHKLICAVDCGPAVYPDAIVAQMEGAAVMALSTAFNEKIHFSGGGVQTANYGTYPLLTMSAVPKVEVHIADSIHTIGGIGEPGVPTVAPAVANAIFTTTGIMLRELPFNLDMLRQEES